MRKRINLLNKSKQYLIYEKNFKKIRKLTIYLLIIFFILLILAYLIIFNINQKLETLFQEKKDLLEYINNNKQVQTDFFYLMSKYLQIKQVVKDDVNFLPYYNILLNSLKESSPSPQLSEIIITNDRVVNFTLNFDSTDAIVNFLKYAESDKFIKNFDHLFISKFSLTDNDKLGQLLFLGKFKSIKDEI